MILDTVPRARASRLLDHKVFLLLPKSIHGLQCYGQSLTHMDHVSCYLMQQSIIRVMISRLLQSVQIGIQALQGVTRTVSVAQTWFLIDQTDPSYSANT